MRQCARRGILHQDSGKAAMYPYRTIDRISIFTQSLSHSEEALVKLHVPSCYLSPRPMAPCVQVRLWAYAAT